MTNDPALPVEVEEALLELTEASRVHGEEKDSYTASYTLARMTDLRAAILTALAAAEKRGEEREREAILDMIENATESDVDPHRTAEVDEEAVWKTCAALIRSRAGAPHAP